MERDSGHVAVGGRLAYAAQQAWIINATGECGWRLRVNSVLVQQGAHVSTWLVFQFQCLKSGGVQAGAMTVCSGRTAC